MMKSLVLPILRHILAAVVAVVLRTLFPEGGETELDRETISSGIDLLTLVLYAVLEKLLKPLSRNWFGEKQPGDTAPPQTPRLLG